MEFLTETERLPPDGSGHGVIEHRVGGAVNLLDGHLRGVVTQWKPPHLLALYLETCSVRVNEESHYPESYVKFELEPRGNEVLQDSYSFARTRAF